jgi:hypothetical protein
MEDHENNSLFDRGAIAAREVPDTLRPARRPMRWPCGTTLFWRAKICGQPAPSRVDEARAVGRSRGEIHHAVRRARIPDPVNEATARTGDAGGVDEVLRRGSCSARPITERSLANDPFARISSPQAVAPAHGVRGTAARKRRAASRLAPEHCSAARAAGTG